MYPPILPNTPQDGSTVPSSKVSNHYDLASANVIEDIDSSAFQLYSEYAFPYPQNTFLNSTSKSVGIELAGQQGVSRFYLHTLPSGIGDNDPLDKSGLVIVRGKSSYKWDNSGGEREEKDNGDSNSCRDGDGDRRSESSMSTPIRSDPEGGSRISAITSYSHGNTEEYYLEDYYHNYPASVCDSSSLGTATGRRGIEKSRPRRGVATAQQCQPTLFSFPKYGSMQNKYDRNGSESVDENEEEEEEEEG